MTINKYLTTINHTALKRSASNIDFIVIHYVGALGDAKANAQYYASQYVGASADFFVGFSGDIWQGNDYLNYYSWHCGGGYQSDLPDGGKFYGICKNSNSIGIEMCVRKKSTRTMNATDKDWYFEAATVNAAAELTAKLMKELNIGIDHVIRHFDVNKKICPNPFVYNNGTYTWDGFKRLVSGSAPAVVHWYRVRKSWADEKSQLGAYEILDNAKANCPVGYSVFDDTGKAVYTPTDAVSTAQPSGKYPSGIPASKEAFIEAVGAICKELYKETHILPSVPWAQCCLETGFGLGSDSTALVQVNNLLGMKVDLINGTWKQWSVWPGKEIVKKTPEYVNGKLVYKDDHFRQYDDYRQCIYDYEQFLLHVRNDKGYKYSCVAGMTEPASVIRRIVIGTGTVDHQEGYCTDPNYESKILSLIAQYNLTRYDNVDPKPQPTPVKDKYAVRHNLNDTVYQLGLFHDLNNAKNLADINWGYKVYDTETNKLIYEPKLTPAQKYVAELVYMDLIMRDDIKAKHPWDYRNKNTSDFAKTFDKARSDNKRHTNCVSGAQWGLLRAGVVGSDRSAIQWYGNKGFVWVGKDAQANAAKYFDLIDMKGKTVKKAISDGSLQPGDILSYQTLSHTNVYLGNKLFFDAGHANCNGSGEGAKFKCWVSATPYQSYKIAQVLRLRNTQPKKVRYRVQCGVYSVKKNADAYMKKVKSKGFDAMLVKEGKNYVVQAGLFDVKENAENLFKKIVAKGLSCMVKEV